MVRAYQVGVRLTPEEQQIVEQAAAETGLSVSDIVRQAIRLAYADRFAALAKKTTRPKR